MMSYERLVMSIEIGYSCQLLIAHNSSLNAPQQLTVFNTHFRNENRFFAFC